MLFSVEQAFVGREEIRAPLKTPAWEANVGQASNCMLETSIVGCGYHGTVVDSNVFHAFVPDILVIRKCYAICSKNKLLRSDFTG